MANRKVPSQAASGFDTFSDNLVGRQITNGTNQLTNTNFSLDKIIPEKDSKNFKTAPFSNFLTLDDLKVEEDVPTTVVQSDGKKRPIKFNSSKKDATKSLFGSLKERLRVSVARIVRNFPAGLYANANSIFSVNNYTCENITYNSNTKKTTFKVHSKKFYNPFEIILATPAQAGLVESENKLRNFYSSYTKYSLEIGGVLYPITSYVEPDINNYIELEVTGKPFTGSTYSLSYLIKPNNAVVEEFFLGLDDLEASILNRETFPIYESSFKVPRTSLDNTKTEIISVVVNWPLSNDNWNLSIDGLAFDKYINQLNDLADEIDDYKSNLVTRFLTAPQLFEFDTNDQKIDKIFQLYGQSFDNVKKYIDNIAYMRNVSYDAVNNIPDVFLKNLANTLGLNTIDLFDEKSLEDQIYSASEVVYDGQSIGKNLVEAELEFYRRILVNLAFIYKSKGTRSSLEFFLKFIGAPEPLIKIDEYVYKVETTISKDSAENDIFNVINNVGLNNSIVFDESTYTYSLSAITGTTTASQSTDYPLDSTTYLPKTPTTNQENIFFQMGSGWYSTTLDHRSSDILDDENSVLTGRTKTILTKSKPYSYGEEFFDIYRTLPGLDYGFTLRSEIDNVKGQIVDDLNLSNLTLNRKNINVFVSPANAINYDIWTKSRQLEVTFGTNSLEPQTSISFSEFLGNILSGQIKNSNLIRYKKNYIQLEDVYRDYINQLQTSGYTPYDIVTVSEFVNKMSPYWANVLDQIIPATTLWLGGNLIENNVFGRPKYAYRKPCKPLEITENLYPDFETFIEEDLETIIGEPDKLRGLTYFTGATFTLSIEIDGIEYNGAIQVPITGSTIFPSGFTATNSCSVLTNSSTAIPLICDYKNWIELDLEIIKTNWLLALSDLVDEINSTYTQYSATNVPDYVPSEATLTKNSELLSYEIFEDVDGKEKIKFILNNTGECRDAKNLDYYFSANYGVTENPSCYIDAEITTPCDVYTGTTVPPACKLVSDVIINLTGVTVQSGNVNTWSVFMHKNCEEGVNAYYDVTNDPDTVFLPVNGESCQFIISNVKEDDVIDILFTDAANCDLKFKIQGLTLQYVEYPLEPDPETALDNITMNTGYTINPIVQFRNSYDVGLKSDTKVYLVSGATINSSTTSANIESYINSGNLIETNVSNLVSGTTILSANYLPCSGLTSTDYENGELNNDYSFSYQYSTKTIYDIDCLGSVKTSVITGITKTGAYEVFEVLPTTKLRVYTNKDVDELNNGLVTKRKSYFFENRSPEFLQIKPDTQVEPCCNYPSDYYDTGDFLINEFGELIEVVAVDLNYCEPNIYYNINVTNDNGLDNLIVFDGNDNHKLLLQHSYAEFNDMDMASQQYYINDTCCTDVPSIESLSRDLTAYVDCEITPAFVCGDEYPVLTPTPTPSPSPTPTPSATPVSTATPTPSPTASSTPTPTPTATATPTPTPTVDCSFDATFTEVFIGATATPTPTPTNTPSETYNTSWFYYYGRVCEEVNFNWNSYTPQEVADYFHHILTHPNQNYGGEELAFPSNETLGVGAHLYFGTPGSYLPCTLCNFTRIQTDAPGNVDPNTANVVKVVNGVITEFTPLTSFTFNAISCPVTNYNISTGHTDASTEGCIDLGGPYPNTAYGNNSDWTSVTRFYSDSSMSIPYYGQNKYYGTDDPSNMGTELQIDNNGYVINSYAC